MVRIARDGSTTTIADTDLAGPVGMVFDSHGNLLMCNCNDQSVKKMSPAGEITTLATSGEFNCPNGITTNPAGDFFVVSFASP
ncbi:MAG: hypothetical protein P8Y44_05980, partial [Acidobacteriota bacterium]